MPMDARDIEALIREAFPKARINVQGDDGQHFAAEVIDESFRGMNRVQQQRAVYAALTGKLDGALGELHALALEWDRDGTSAADRAGDGPLGAAEAQEGHRDAGGRGLRTPAGRTGRDGAAHGLIPCHPWIGRPLHRR